MNQFRRLSLIEGCSLLLLLFIAMPLKYYFGIREPVFYIGMVHGLLFLSYGVMSLVISHKHNWSVAYWLLILFAGVLPFGFLLIDKKLRQPVAEPVASEVS